MAADNEDKKVMMIQQKLKFFKYLPHSRHCSKTFAYVLLQQPHTDTQTQKNDMQNYILLNPVNPFFISHLFLI